ncbi:MAG: hypothetical protein KDA28_11820, partial [Phycisphaerales bacterium]|nr:hypothetical protein [Phycisphaerales bacterium]
RILEDQHRITRFETQVHDLQTRLSRAEGDRVAIVALTKRHEAQLKELQARLGNLMDSRWRKYGQRLGVVMTLPWESEMRNGK